MNQNSAIKSSLSVETSLKSDDLNHRRPDLVGLVGVHPPALPHRLGVVVHGAPPVLWPEVAWRHPLSVVRHQDLGPALWEFFSKKGDPQQGRTTILGGITPIFRSFSA